MHVIFHVFLLQNTSDRADVIYDVIREVLLEAYEVHFILLYFIN